MRDLGRRISIGFTAGVLAGLVDLYVGFVIGPNFVVVKHYQLLIFIIFLSLTPYVVAGLSAGFAYHLIKLIPFFRKRALFRQASATVIALTPVLLVSLKLLWLTKAHRLVFGSWPSLINVLLALLLFGPVVFGLYKISAIVDNAVKRLGVPLRSVLNTVLAVLLVIPAVITSYFTVRDLFARKEQPLVCFLLIDTLRADHCSCYGYERKTTPQIDSIADGGTMFDNCQSQAPWTKPSVATIFTGLPAAGHNVERVFDSLPKEAITVAEVLRSNGYTTLAYSANYHITPQFDFDQGFDYFATTETPPTFFNGTLGVQVYNRAFFRHYTGKSPEPALYTVRRVSFILRYLNDDPIFLYMHFMEPHEPYTPSRRFKDAFGPPIDSVKLSPDRVHMEVEFIADPEVTLDLTESEVQELIRRYDCEILQCDYAVGELINGLKREGLLDDSLVVITADHGEEFMEHGFLYHARALYRESIHVPLIIVNSRENNPTPRVSEPVALADLTPTIYDWAGVSPPPEVAPDFYGISLVPAMEGDRLSPDRLLISEINRDVYSGNVWNPSEVGAPVGYLTAESIMGPDYKLIRDHNRDRDFAFDLKHDLHEQRPLLEKPDEYSELEKALDETIEYYEEKSLESETGVIDEESWRKMRDMGYVR
ncbi:MAG: sulfatase [Candidatus Coatesbacteria bacterium]|nr:MAG: sulfatase [Candidatus Coatesbacteria bacterium]